MKKAVISLLVILPLLLVAVIAVAGRIYGSHEYIEVTEIYFVDEDNNRINSISVDIGEQKRLNYIINPILATNKNVTFKSDDERICVVDNNGFITGMAVGKTDVTVETLNSKQAKITVNVASTGATDMELSYTNMVGHLGCNAVLSVSTTPSIEAQYVTWISSNEEIVSVSGTGREVMLSFNKTGSATITAMSRDGLKKTCEIVVQDGNVAFTSNNIRVDTNSIDLLDYITNYTSQDIYFEVLQGSGYTLSGTILTKQNGGIVRVKMYCIGENTNNILNYDEAVFIF